MTTYEKFENLLKKEALSNTCFESGNVRFFNFELETNGLKKDDLLNLFNQVFKLEKQLDGFYKFRNKDECYFFCIYSDGIEISAKMVSCFCRNIYDKIKTESLFHKYVTL